MTFTFGDSKVSLINLFPSMPLRSCVRTLDFKGAAVHSSYLLPEPLIRGQMLCPCLTRATHGPPRPRLSTVLAILWCWYMRPLFHLVICKPTQALPSNEEGGYLQWSPSDRYSARARLVTVSCLLCVLRDAAWMFILQLTSPWMSNASSGPLGINLYSGNPPMGFCYSLVCFLCH